MKGELFHQLSIIRDKGWIPGWLRSVIDYIRYEWLWSHE